MGTTNSTHDWLQLCDDVDDGEWDAGLNEIAKAVSSRLDIVARRNARRLQRSLEVGDRVKLTNGIKPRYLNNMVGRIEDIRDGAAVVKLDKMPSATGAGRPPEGGYKDKLMVPFAYLQKLDKKTADLAEVDEAADIGDDAEYEDDIEELDDDD